MTYGSGRFVAVADNASAASTDGITWAPDTTGLGVTYSHSSAYGANTFVAVEYGGSVSATSSDGITWAWASNLPSSQNWYVIFGGSTFLAFSETGQTATSLDGSAWAGSSFPAPPRSWNVTYGNGTFVAIPGGATNISATSPDGITWTEHLTLPSSQSWSVIYGGGKFVAFAAANNVVATSTDGISWTQYSTVLPSGTSWGGVTYGGGTFVAVTYWGSTVAATSTDGITWTQGTLPSSQYWSSVAYGAGMFVSVTSNGSNVAATTSIGGVGGQPWLNFVQGGTFQLDATASNLQTVSSLYMSQKPVTRTQYLAVMGTDPTWLPQSSGTSDPVQALRWYHAIAYCNKLSLAEGLTPVYSVSGVDFSTLTFAQVPTVNDTAWNNATAAWNNNGYRLPTEMEYRWAAMGGLSDTRAGDIVGGANTGGYKKGYSGSSELDYAQGNMGNFAWYAGNSGATTRPAGSKLPNELGLYDLTGNVGQWCWDASGGLPSGSYSDYKGPARSNVWVVGGSDFNSSGAGCYLSNRGGWDTASGGIGFRVVRYP